MVISLAGAKRSIRSGRPRQAMNDDLVGGVHQLGLPSPTVPLQAMWCTLSWRTDARSLFAWPLTPV